MEGEGGKVVVGVVGVEGWAVFLLGVAVGGWGCDFLDGCKLDDGWVCMGEG